MMNTYTAETIITTIMYYCGVSTIKSGRGRGKEKEG
jgi:hypothetical protein